ncbi:MAG: hypothetical protein FWD06_03260 [Oscillospiraceae bacterium]|nr:hypothetical protein [Oscillospiraceae bacterium]
MATYCPNPACNLKLKLTDWKPACPKCGVNIQFYRIEERLTNEADHVELASTAFSLRLDRAKSALFSTPMAKLRMYLEIFAPLGLLGIPLAVHAILSAIADGDFMENFMPSMLRYVDFDDPASLLSGNIWVLLFVLGLGLAFPLLWLAVNICKPFGCGLKWFGRSLIINGAGIVCAALALVALLQFNLVQPLSLRQHQPETFNVVLTQTFEFDDNLHLLSQSFVTIPVRRSHYQYHTIELVSTSVNPLQNFTFRQAVPEGTILARGTTSTAYNARPDFNYIEPDDGYNIYTDIIWNIGELAPGDLLTLSFRVHTDEPAVHGNIDADAFGYLARRYVRPGDYVNYNIAFTNYALPAAERAVLHLQPEGVQVSEIEWEITALAAGDNTTFVFETTSTEPPVAQPFVIAGLIGLMLAYLLILLVNIKIRRQGGLPVKHSPSWVAFMPTEEVYAYLARSGNTIKDLREEKAAEAGEPVPTRSETACPRCGCCMLNREHCEYCKLHAAALAKYETQLAVTALLAQRRAGGNWNKLEG